MTSSDGDHAGEPGPAATRAPRRWNLRNWRVRTRLVSLIAVPTVVAVVLGALGLSGALGSAAAYGRVGTLAGLAGAVTTTVDDLQAEQSASAAFVGAGRPAGAVQGVTDAQRRTDGDSARLRAAAAAVGSGYPQSTQDRLRRVLFRLDTLPALRSAVVTDQFPAGVTVDRYDTVVTDLVALDDEIALEGTDPGLSGSVRALGALSRAKAALATQRALLGAALQAGRFEPGGDAALVRAVAAQESALEQFRTTATVAQTQNYDDVVAGPDVDQTSAVRDAVVSGRPPAGGPAGAATWQAAASGTLDKVGTVESGLVRSIADRASTLRADQVRQAVVVGIVALAVILIVLLATTAVARSLVRPLRALRDGALAVAERRLPATVARLGREDPDTVDTRVDPIAVHTSDEIGEVARSFDAVHQEAVRAAAGEARRRAQAGALFVTLSRRTQSLVDRQIELIDDLEQGEEDADRLDNLFRLDHLATRMRRNGENLLVLGGQEPMRRWNRTLPMLDVLRASLSEIEQYPRIDLEQVPDVAVAEGAASDVVHLLAELLDNATAFSSRTSRVRVVATVLPDRSALVEIADRGIGLTEQECEDLGRRLSAPAGVDVDVSRRMGLYVVGRLADRLGARVWLRPGEKRGVTASVALPATVLTSTSAADPGPPEPEAATAVHGSDGSWIGERFSRAVSTPGPGPASWFGGASLAGPSAGEPEPAAPDVSAFVPTASGTTTAGLPRREPGANELPGAVPPETDAGPPDAGTPGAGGMPTGRHAAPDDPSEAADRSPDAVRRRYGAYQAGRRRGGVPLPDDPDTGPATPDRPGAATPTPTPEPTFTREPTFVPGPVSTPDPTGPGAGAPSSTPDERPSPPPETPWGAGPVRKPTAAGSTSSGLPLRAPGANYVAGSLPEFPADDDPASLDGTGGRAGTGGIPGGWTPGAWTPGGNTAPGNTAPGNAGPGGAAPGSAAPGNAAPGNAAPGSAVPGGGFPDGEDTAGDGTAGRETGRPAWDRSAEAIRQRFAAHQQGRRRGMESAGR